MTEGKYSRLIKPLNMGIVHLDEQQKMILGPGSASREIWLNGRDHLEGMNISFSWGIHNTPGDWHSGARAHAHAYPECLFFVGLDTANINYLGAEIECSMGIDHTSYAFNEPTVLVIPAGCPHGPISTKRVFSPRGFGFFTVSLSPAFDAAWSDAGAPAANSSPEKAPGIISLKTAVVTERKKTNRSRFTWQQLVQRDELEEAGVKAGPGNADHMVWINGNDLGALNVNVSWGFCSSPGIWQRGFNSHAHPNDEVLILLGMNPSNPDELGAEIEIDLGPEHERHIIDKPSAVICPAQLPHAPIVTRWADRPFAFILINLADLVAMSIE